MRGHQLIADDAVEWQRGARGTVVGHCPPLLRDLVEIRGLGILNVRRLYGGKAVARSARLDLVVDLGPVGPIGPAEPQQRLHGRRSVSRLLGAELPQISLRRRVGHNLAVLVEAACRDHRLRLSGYRADEDLVERQRKSLKAGKI